MKPATFPDNCVVSLEPAAVSAECSQRGSFSHLMRYLRLYGLIVRTCLLREMMFRTNFLVRLITHVVWLALMLVFVKVIFLHSLLVMLAACSVWTVRHSELYELWFYL